MRSYFVAIALGAADGRHGGPHTMWKHLVLAAGLGMLTGCGTSPGGTLFFAVQPGTSVTGGLMRPPVEVLVQDERGYWVIADTDITVAIGTNSGGGVLSGVSTVRAVNGTATFTDLSIDEPGAGYTLTAEANGFGGVTSSRFDIVGAPVATITVTPGRADAGPGDSVRFLATVSDAAGNELTGRTVRWTIGDLNVVEVISNEGDTDGGVNGVYVCGLGPGAVTVTATSGAVSGTAMLTESGYSSGTDRDWAEQCCEAGC